jgi:hypothetical protein
MESKWEAVIQYFRNGILALAKLTERKPPRKRLGYDLVIKFGGDFVLRQNQSGFSGDQAQPNGIASQTAPQVENQGGRASDNQDVQGGNTSRRLVQVVDINALCLHFLQAHALFLFFPLAEPVHSHGHGFLPKIVKNLQIV